MDVFPAKQRSEIMRRVRSKNTRPDIAVCKLLREAGYKYHTHSKSLPGTPDVVFPARKKAIFIHGCFWHRHVCGSATLPKSNRDYWEGKQNRNVARDNRNARSLRASGWGVLTVWECQIKNVEKLHRRLQRFLEA
jgi:DNA mismatch endonuclease (patch repair protein)